MKRFTKELEKQIRSNAEKEALSRKYDIECPSCHALFQAKPGKGHCPVCNKAINFQLDVTYEE